MRKGIIIGILIGFILATVLSVSAVDKDTYFKWFGPVLLEAMIRLTVSEINILRVEVGLEPRTGEQIRTALRNKHAEVQAEYDALPPEPKPWE